LRDLDLAVDEQGGIRAWGRANGFSASFISSVLNGQTDPSKRLLRVLGWQRVWRLAYRHGRRVDVPAVERVADPVADPGPAPDPVVEAPAAPSVPAAPAPGHAWVWFSGGGGGEREGER
jgi:hypothetical protein